MMSEFEKIKFEQFKNTLGHFTVELTRIESNHNNLRDDVIVGQTFKLPTVGERFSMVGEPRDPEASGRVIWTTTVRDVIDDGIGGCTFKTTNSVYHLKVTEV